MCFGVSPQILDSVRLYIDMAKCCKGLRYSRAGTPSPVTNRWRPPFDNIFLNSMFMIFRFIDWKKHQTKMFLNRVITDIIRLTINAAVKLQEVSPLVHVSQPAKQDSGRKLEGCSNMGILLIEDSYRSCRSSQFSEVDSWPKAIGTSW